MYQPTTTTTVVVVTFPFTLSLLVLILSLRGVGAAAADAPLPATSSVPSDAVALLSFKSKADLDDKLRYALTERFDYCRWQGVKCVRGRVVRLNLLGFGLRGDFPRNTLNRLDQLRSLILHNNSLAGPIPDLSGLVNLRTLLLSYNSFSGDFPKSVLSLHRLSILDLSHNRLAGPLPAEINVLDRLNYLRLDSNEFSGAIPPLNQSSLDVFNAAGNNFSGPIPVTPTLSRFNMSSFSRNPRLCGEIVNRVCTSPSPFFRSPSFTASAPTPLRQNTNEQSEGVVLPPSSPKKQMRIGIVLGTVIGVLFLIAAILSFSVLIKKRNTRNISKSEKNNSDSVNAIAIAQQGALIESETEDKRLGFPQTLEMSENLVFCEGGEPDIYTLEKLMRASAELLGRGTIGTTYKAAMENGMVVSVKRLDACKTAATSNEMFERHMESVGVLRHPNLVPVRAFFQAKQERLIIYDYQPNGSLFNLVHGSRSTRAKPLHWTSCLKLAEDVARGLAYIHQESGLVHGNLKSSNVLLGTDFEACLSDYCLSVFANDSCLVVDPDCDAYRAPEIHKSPTHHAVTTSKSDVYAFGVLLLELLTGKPPSQHPFLVPAYMPDWVRAMREDEAGERNQLDMLVEVAGVCSLPSPEKRPTMWQVMKMIQEIKESVTTETSTNPYIEYS